MPEYTILTVLSIVLVVALELGLLRTGIFRSGVYWISLVIVLGFQVLVDGWLTKLSDPIVLYAESMTTGIRFPWDIPVEDFGFGFSRVTLTMMLWLRGRSGTAHATGASRSPAPVEDGSASPGFAPADAGPADGPRA